MKPKIIMMPQRINITFVVENNSGTKELPKLLDVPERVTKIPEAIEINKAGI